MSFDEFIEKVKGDLGDYLLNYNVTNIYIKEVYKNNGIIYNGLVIKTDETGIAPTIYLEPYYKAYKNGMNMEDIMSNIRDEYAASLKNAKKAEQQIQYISEYKERVFIKVVNYEKNKEELASCPYIPFHDLAITFRYMVFKDNSGMSSVLVTNRLTKEWNIDTRELYNQAYENTKKIFPPVIKRLDDVLFNGLEEYIGNAVYSGFYLLSSDCGLNGSVYIIYKDFLSDFSKKNECDFYIIPSSVHELILVKSKAECNPDNLRLLIKDVNELLVPGVDFLSDNIYYFSISDGLHII
ncbi:MAG: hypothetical protein IJV15_10065 [Lachnospiraceae bacterium]|nr:hypothetical protein [Lachnospiraceae bacterium]